MSNESVRRRHFLATAAFATAGVGGLFALWPFVAAMQPDQETIARRVTFSTRDLIGTTRAMIGVRHRPVAIFRRTEEELGRLRDASAFNGRTFRDRDSNQSSQPVWAKNWHRSLRPEIMVCDGLCSRGDCVLSQPGGFDSDAIVCPCCGSRYDLAGRVFAGPAPHNLSVPPYRFVDETTIEFVESEVLMMGRGT